MEDDSHGFEPTVEEENAGIEHKGVKLKCLTSSGWTDEKHMNYLSSVEQSFVDQLNNKNCEGLLNFSHRKNISPISTDGRQNFKMLNKGGWEVFEYGSSEKEIKSEEERKNKTVLLSNPWIQRLRSSCSINNTGFIARDHRADDHASEGSDQNFWDEEIGVVESNRAYSKKRPRS